MAVSSCNPLGSAAPIDPQKSALSCSKNVAVRKIKRLAKGESAALRIEFRATESTGGICLTLKIAGPWARNRYIISSIAPMESVPGVTGEPQGPPLTRIEPGMDRKQNDKKLPKLREQEEIILDEIRRRGYDPKSLPKNEDGKPGVKAEIRNALKNDDLFAAVTAFDWAWERLRAGDGAIANMK